MRCLTLAALVILVTIVAARSASAAETQTTGCTPPPGTANLIVCFGSTPCPPGYVDPVGMIMRNLGVAGRSALSSQSSQRWLCQQPVPSQSSSSSTGSTDTSNTSSTAAATPTPTPTAPACSPPTPTPTVLVAQSSALGSFLTNAQCMTLYVYASDTPGSATCLHACAIIWLPLQPPTGALTNPSDATGALAVITRDDGQQQVTYNGMPLYTYTGDLKPGDTTGQGLAGIWQVATP